MDMETKVLDRNAEWFGVSTETLMENAGRAVAEEAKKLRQKWLVLCGTGNNGGDGYVAARYIKNAVVIYTGKPRTSLARKNYRRAKAMGIPLLPYTRETLEKEINKCDGIVDALLGVGIRGDLREPYREIVEIINNASCYILSVDVPSGMGGNLFVKADKVVTFHFIKEGTEEICKDIEVADIGIPEEAERYVGAGEMLYYPKPAKNAHKGDNGVVAVVGGGPYTGAPALAAMAALRSGCDLAYVCTPSRIWNVVASFAPEIIVREMEGDHFSPHNIDEIRDLLNRADAILLGPGMGKNEESMKACRMVIEEYMDKKQFVIDADAIEAVKDIKFNGNAIITPHAGEFRKLTGISLPEDIEERRKIVMEEAEKRNATILLKGAVDIISDGKRVKMNIVHNEAMTVGGTGDLLAGISACILSKDVNAFHAACMAAFMNGMAGNMAFDDYGYGMVAGDMLEYIPEVIKEYVY